MDITSVTSIAKTSLEIKDFIEGGALANFLFDLAGDELACAQEIFRDLPEAKSKKLAINRALGHLESAHKAYYRIHNPLVFNQARYVLRPDIYDNARVKNFWVCCLMALCHHYLGDSQEIIKKKLTTAEYILGHLTADGKDSLGSFGEYADNATGMQLIPVYIVETAIGVFFAPFAFLHPYNWKEYFNPETTMMNRHKFRTFCENLDAISIGDYGWV